MADAPTHKRCPGCTQVLPASAFSRNVRAYDGLQSYCRTCVKAKYPRRSYSRPRTEDEKRRLRERYRDDPTYRAKINEGNRARRANCPPELYDDMLRMTNGGCWVCRGVPDTGVPALAADHCHTTREVRGVLCSRCNTGLGQFRDNPTLLVLAAAYLVAGPRRRWSSVDFTVYDDAGNPLPPGRHMPRPVGTHTIRRTRKEVA